MMKIRKGIGALALLAGWGLLVASMSCFGGCCPFNALSEKRGISQAMAGQMMDKTLEEIVAEGTK